MRFSIKLFCSAIVVSMPMVASAQSAPEQLSESDGVQEIVVTAQKRAESINKVPMSITAVGGQALATQGITSANDLTKIVSGFTFSESERGAPVFGIRGIVFADTTLGSASAVALYKDEVPLSSSNEARISSTMDLERVEVLKGPQGILFGQNSTAGAINFVAAKPTNTLRAGVDGTYSRFNTFDARAFLSGPITDTLKFRASAMGVRSNGWQKSYTRDDRLGSRRQFAGRMILQWEPLSRLRLTARVDGWRDKSDTVAVQLIESVPFIPAGVNPIYDFYPRAPNRNRAADWDQNSSVPFRRDDDNLQASGRIEYDLTDSIQLTSISAWTRYNQDYSQDIDGTAYTDNTFHNIGSLHRFSQEVRVSATFDQLRLLVGANYTNEKARNFTDYLSGGNSSGPVTGILGTQSTANQKIRDYAAFANADYSFGNLTAHAGIRYTEDKRRFSGCLADNGDGTAAGLFNAILGVTGTANAIQPGGCVTVLGPQQAGNVDVSLNQHNVSWRAGLDWQATPSVLVYGNVSRGYKSGSFQDVNAAVASQYAPATQESVLSYEAGVKAGLLDRAVQLNVSGFYYDYKDKQLFGRLLDPLNTFGVLQFLLNVPKSRAYGAEAQLDVRPATGLTLNFAATYVNTKVKSEFVAIDPVGNSLNYKGLAFPYTPKLSMTAAFDYERPVTSALKAFVGGNAAHQSSTMAFFNDPALVGQTQASPVLRPGVLINSDVFKIKSFVTVDARLGIADKDDRWRAWIWGRNIFNTHYWSNVLQVLDTVGRYAGAPATYGVSASLRI